MRDDRIYLLHALDALDAIDAYTGEGRDAFFADRKTQDAVIRNVEIIGQAVKGLSERTRARLGGRHELTRANERASVRSACPWRPISTSREGVFPARREAIPGGARSSGGRA